MNIYNLNMGNDSSRIDTSKYVDKLLESLKTSIDTKINESYKYSHFRNVEDIIEWKNKIIKLIKDEIDQYKKDNLNNLNQNPKYDKSKGNQIVEKHPYNSRIKGRVYTQNINQNGYITHSGFQGKIIAPNLNPKGSTTQFQQGKSDVQKSFLDNSKINETKINQRENKNDKLDFFTSKDIQEENKEITRIFQKESLNHIDDDEKEENESIGHFLKEVALISRMAYNTSNELFIKMFNEFLKDRSEKKNISDLKNDELLKKRFSSWVKQYEKDPKGMQLYKDYFDSFTGRGIYNNNQYLFNLLSQLIKLYFHCEISFPNVEVVFDLNKEIKFIHEKMIDFINKGNNRKVDFVILPSLFSNGNYLENGKFWVFTYKKDTFKFGELKFESLVNKEEKYNSTDSKKDSSNSKTNNMNTSSLRKEGDNSSRIRKSKEIPKNTYIKPKEKENTTYIPKKIKHNKK